MKRSPFLLPIALVAALAACQDRDDRAGGAMDSPAVDGADMAPQSPPAATGADATVEERGALGVLNAINAHEIAAAEQALSKGVSGDVADYARMMQTSHAQNREQTTALGADDDHARAQAQRDKGQAERQALDGREGDDYARAYIDAMVTGHAQALETLDNELIPAATTPAVRDHLAATRSTVAAHLQQARALQDAAPGNAQGAADGADTPGTGAASGDAGGSR